MKRRQFLGLVTSAAILLPHPASSQAVNRTYQDCIGLVACDRFESAIDVVGLANAEWLDDETKHTCSCV